MSGVLCAAPGKHGFKCIVKRTSDVPQLNPVRLI